MICYVCSLVSYEKNCTVKSLKTPFLSYQDLSKEQVRAQELSTEVQRLSQKLQKAEAEQRTVTDSLSQSQERIESLAQCLEKSESRLELEKRRGGVELDRTSNLKSESQKKTGVSEPHTEVTSPLDPLPGAVKGRDLSRTHDQTTRETERQLSERLTELEKEVCICV